MDFNQTIIDEFRANKGQVGGQFEGAPLLLLHTTGAKSGQERVHPMMFRQVGDDVVVFGSLGGAPHHPAWFHNLVAHPDVTAEIGAETVELRARVTEGIEREEIWKNQKADWPGFAEYETKTDRVIPVVILERRSPMPTSPDDAVADSPAIRVIPNGPYAVSAGVPLVDKTPIMSEHGEPLTWKTGDTLQDGSAPYRMCRCGGSSTLPLCDGAHANNGFTDNEPIPAENVGQPVSLGGEGIEIFDNRKLCMHAGFCGTRVTNIWKIADQTGDTTVRAQAMAMIERCPSGALTYAVDGDPIEPSLPPEIAVVPDGPLWVTGNLTIQAPDSDPATESRNRVTLCRCGASANKPLCDGAHKTIGFHG